jgi:hypothetical protein
MNMEATSLLTAADLAAVETFAQVSGIESSRLIYLAVQALAAHVRSNGTLSLPVRIGLPSPLCQYCPVAKALNQPPVAAAPNILSGPWT